MGFIGTQQLVLILLIVLVLFGAKRVPELAKGLGAGIREFKKAARDVQQDQNATGNSSETTNAGANVNQTSEAVSSSSSSSASLQKDDPHGSS